jgi:hypothetical protein
MAMSEHSDEYAADPIEVPLALHIPQMKPISPVEDQGRLDNLRGLLEIKERVLQ